jgi:hypothetical protein
MMLCLAVPAAMAVSGCVVPVRMKNRVEGPAGRKEGLPKEILVPGTTTRQEVEERYKGFAVDTGIPNLFWGRFRESSWAVVYGVAGYGGGAAGGGRKWNVRNLLVAFNEDGTVRDSAAVADEEFQDRLSALVAELAAPPMDLSQPVKVGGLPPEPREVGAGTIDLELTSVGLVVTRYRYWISKKMAPPPPTVATVPLERLESLTVGQGHAREAARMGVVLRFRGKTEVGRRLAFWVEPEVAPILARWLAQVKPRSLR